MLCDVALEESDVSSVELVHLHVGLGERKFFSSVPLENVHSGLQNFRDELQIVICKGCVGIPYRLVQVSTNTVEALIIVTAMNGMSRVIFVNWSSKTITNCFRAFILGTWPIMSIARIQVVQPLETVVPASDDALSFGALPKTNVQSLWVMHYSYSRQLILASLCIEMSSLAWTLSYNRKMQQLKYACANWRKYNLL